MLALEFIPYRLCLCLAPCNLPMALFIDRKCKIRTLVILFDINVWTFIVRIHYYFYFVT